MSSLALKIFFEKKKQQKKNNKKQQHAFGMLSAAVVIGSLRVYNLILSMTGKKVIDFRNGGN